MGRSVLFLIGALVWVSSGVADAQGQQTTSRVAITELIPGPMTLSPGETHRLDFKVVLTVDHITCATDATLNVDVVVAAPGVRANATSPVRFVIPGGLPHDSAVPGSQAYNQSQPSTLTVIVPADAQGGLTTAVVRANLQATTDSACPTASIPAATDSKAHTISVGPAPSNNGTTPTNETNATAGAGTARTPDLPAPLVAVALALTVSAVRACKRR